MKIFNNISAFKNVNIPVLTIGTFDGVHLGHKKIISRLCEIASKSGGETVVLTFHPHPRVVLGKDISNLKMLNTQEEKLLLLEKAGIQNVIVHPFTKSFSELASTDFILKYLTEKIGVKKLVIGYNHHFGKDREGSFEHLQKMAIQYNFEVEEIPAQDLDDIEISSTKIRNALLAGNVALAAKFLGYNYFMSGIVVEGKKLGRKLGYPTANIEISDSLKLIPADGIYVVKIETDNKIYGGMMSIGMNPTFGGEKKTIEVNIFDFEKDIYGKKITVNFIGKIRNEEKFSSLDELKLKLDSDKKISLKILSSLEN